MAAGTAVMTTRTVPYQATRTVKVCVPYTETVTMTRMVAKTVQKQVPVMTCGGCGGCGYEVGCGGCGGGHHRGRRHTCGGC